MLGSGQPLRHRIRWRRRLLLWLLVAPLAALAVVIAVDRVRLRQFGMMLPSGDAEMWISPHRCA